MSSKSREENEAVQGACVAIGLLLSFPLSIWHAYVVTVLWRWFVVEPFNVAALGLWHAYGLLILLRLALLRSSAAKTETDYVKVLGMEIGTWGLGPAISLGVGWVVLQLMT